MDTIGEPSRVLFQALESSQDGFALIYRGDTAGPSIFWSNPALARLLDVEPARLHQAPLRTFPGLQAVERRARRKIERGLPHAEILEGWGPERDRALSVELQRVAMAPDPPYLLLTTRDVTEERRTRALLDRLAHHDALTGLPNRRLLIDRLGVARARARRYRERLAVLFVDLDGFKTINGRHGHLAGDAVLREVARRLTALVRASDTVARIGGDEFVVLLAEIGEIAHAEQVAAKALAAIRAPLRVGDAAVEVRASIGIAVWPDHAETAAALLQAADAAMYQVKTVGKDDLRTWSPADRALRASQRSATAAPARPTDTPTARVPAPILAGDRALHGIEVAVPHGAELSDEAWGELLRAGIDAIGPANLALHVDVPRSVLVGGRISATLRATLGASDLPLSRLWLELREADLIAIDGPALSQLTDLAEAGAVLVVDGFGANSLLSPGRLRGLPVEAVKLDAETVRAGLADPPLLRGLIALCEALDLRVLASGVDEEATFQALVGLGVTGLQGALAGPWGPPAAVTARRRLQ